MLTVYRWLFFCFLTSLSRLFLSTAYFEVSFFA